MKMLRLWLAMVFIGSSILLCGCGSAGGGGGVGNLYGTVVNIAYSPISNADVIVGSTAAKTVSNGRYSFVNLPSGVKIITINSVAHTSSYRKVTFTGGTNANAGIAVLADLDSKVTPITSAGGTATNTTGSIKMVFPAGAFTTTTNVILTTVPKVAAPYNPPAGDQFVSYIIYAKPDNVTLDAQARLSIPNLTQVPATFEVNFYKFNTNTLNWDLLGYGYPSAVTGTIDFNTYQMGWIAAIMQIFPSPGSIQGTVTSSGTPVSGANVWTTTNYDVTDSSGNYTLTDIPVGTTEVYASALGYSLYSSSQTVTSGNQTTLNIDLGSKSPQGNITGIVKQRFSPQIYQARVAESNGGVAYTDQNGIYTLYNVPAGTTNVSAYADNYISSSESVTVINGSTVNANTFYLPFVGTSDAYDFNFESGTQGFITLADQYGHNFWHRQDATESHVDYFSLQHGAVTQKVYLADSGNIPPTHDGRNFYFWYGQTSPATVEASYIGNQDPQDIATTESGTGGNSYVNGNNGTLESPELNLAGYSFGKFSFWTWWEIEGKNPAQGNGYDSMLIEVSKKPYSTWDLLGYLNPYEDPAKSITVSGEAYTSGGFNLPGVWVQHNFDLTPYAGDIIKIRFIFNTGDRKYNGFRGWFLDDISVSNSQLGISSFGSHGIKRYPPARVIQRN
jgi:Carboxypeptidase regulatory-like domain